MSTLRVDRVEDREGNPLWDTEQGILGNVITSTGTQPVAAAVDGRLPFIYKITDLDGLLESMLEGQSVSLLGAIFTRTSSGFITVDHVPIEAFVESDPADWGSAVLSALEDGYKLSFLEGKEYPINDLQVPSSVKFIEFSSSGSGKSSIIMDDPGATDCINLHPSRSADATATATTPIAKSTGFIPLSSTAGVEVGMLGIVLSNSAWYHQSDRFKGELVKVLSVSETGVFTEKPIQDTYEASEAVTVRFFEPVKLRMKNMRVAFRAGLLDNFGTRFRYLDAPEIIDCEYDGFSYIGLGLESCYKSQVINPVFRNHNQDGILGYGSVSYGSTDTYYANVTGIRNRKTIDMSGLSSTAPDRGCEVNGFNITGLMTDEAFDDASVENSTSLGPHPHAADTLILSGIAEGVRYGIVGRGQNLTISDVDFVGRMQATARVYDSANLEYTNNRIKPRAGISNSDIEDNIAEHWIDFDRENSGPAKILGNIGFCKNDLVNYRIHNGDVIDNTIAGNEVTFVNSSGDICHLIGSPNARALDGVKFKANAVERFTDYEARNLGRWKYVSSNQSVKKGEVDPCNFSLRMEANEVREVSIGTTGRALLLVSSTSNTYRGGMVQLYDYGLGTSTGFAMTDLTGWELLETMPDGSTATLGNFGIYMSSGKIYVENRTGSIRYASLCLFPSLTI